MKKSKYLKYNLFCAAAVALATLNFTGCTSLKDEWQQEVAQGNAYYQALVANSYINGFLFNVDYNQAKSLASQSASVGDPMGLYILGVINHEGLAMQYPDTVQAHELFERAIPGLRSLAISNNVYAQNALGEAFLNGYGVKQNYSQAMQFFKRAAAESYIPAIANVGFMYLNGIDVQPNTVRAMEYFQRSISKNYPPALYGLGLCYAKRKEFEKAALWFRKAARLNYPPAMNELGVMYTAGKGVPKDLKTAFALFKNAAKNGNAAAQKNLGALYLNGIVGNSKADIEKGFNWLKCSISRNYIQAMPLLADCYSDGFGTNKNQVKAMILYNLSQKNGIKSVEEKISILDRSTGLYSLVKEVWAPLKKPANFIKYDSSIEREIEGFKADITGGTMRVFERNLNASPSSYYYMLDWYHVYKNNMPMKMAGQIFAAVNNKVKSTAGYWLCYGVASNLSARPDFAMYSTVKLREIAQRNNDKTLSDMAALTRASALMIITRKNDAYNFLFENGKLDASNTILLNYINHWAQPLLIDAKKLSVTTGFPVTSLGSFKEIPKQQEFYDAETNRMTKPQYNLQAPQIDYKRFNQ
ncbi:tetratricopeptide repeat protein [Lentisphaerota bacterium WC36G]|nr:sel1 repeat family protein [Lentisphaerae bacterium WC36]